MKKFLTITLSVIAAMVIIAGCKKSDNSSAKKIATISTSAISNITDATATCGGNVTSDGGATVAAKGVCWSESDNPTISLSTKTSDGSGTGSFVSSLADLTPGTKYYVRAYATNSTGTAYGSVMTFTTESKYMPSLSTTAVTDITLTSATSGGNITNDGGAPVTARGVCWSTNHYPTTGLTTKTNDGSGIGSYASNITGLASGTTYYVRAYATNSAGTAYGTEVTFTVANAAMATLITTPVTGVAFSSVTSGGTVNTDGGSTVTNRGVCWSTSHNPTASLATKTSDGSGLGVFASNPTNLQPSTTYYIRAYATNSAGTAYGNEIMFTTSALAIGDNWGGGTVFYILGSGDAGYSATTPHGLIAAPSDIASAAWGCTSTLVGGTYQGIGTGSANTAIIASSCGSSTPGYACSVLTTGGYTDWYLPSLDELKKVSANQSVLSGLGTNQYWSSSEYTNTNAFFVQMSTGGASSDFKTSSKKVRAIRSY